MKPALSVIFFTVMSGAGYGLWCLLGLALAAGIYPLSGMGVLVPLGFGFVLVSAGLLASTMHLGRPGRAWRALSQWRSSWLSREGIASLVTYLPMLAMAWFAFIGHAGTGLRVSGALLALGALATILCTANIYRSLKTIAAWRTRQVLPLYFIFALLSGGLWLWTWLALTVGAATSLAFPLALLGLAIIAAVIKVDHWKCADALPVNTAGNATGLAMLGRVRAFEGPVTEESYLTREMAFVLAGAGHRGGTGCGRCMARADCGARRPRRSVRGALAVLRRSASCGGGVLSANAGLKVRSATPRFVTQI